MTYAASRNRDLYLRTRAASPISMSGEASVVTSKDIWMSQVVERRIFSFFCDLGRGRRLHDWMIWFGYWHRKREHTFPGVSRPRVPACSPCPHFPHCHANTCPTDFCDVNSKPTGGHLPRDILNVDRILWSRIRYSKPRLHEKSRNRRCMKFRLISGCL